METNSSGFTVLTQWFERARFEYVPTNPDPYKVLLGRLGAEAYDPSAGGPTAIPPGSGARLAAPAGGAGRLHDRGGRLGHPRAALHGARPAQRQPGLRLVDHQPGGPAARHQRRRALRPAADRRGRAGGGPQRRVYQRRRDGGVPTLLRRRRGPAGAALELRRERDGPAGRQAAGPAERLEGPVRPPHPHDRAWGRTASCISRSARRAMCAWRIRRCAPRSCGRTSTAAGWRCSRRGCATPSASTGGAPTNELWGADMGRNNLGQDRVADELDLIEQGKNYGWPYCYDDGVPNPEFNDPARCAGTVPPAFKFPPHWAPLGFVFYNRAGRPAELPGRCAGGVPRHRPRPGPDAGRLPGGARALQATASRWGWRTWCAAGTRTAMCGDDPPACWCCLTGAC